MANWSGGHFTKKIVSFFIVSKFPRYFLGVRLDLVSCGENACQGPWANPAVCELWAGHAWAAKLSPSRLLFCAFRLWTFTLCGSCITVRCLMHVLLIYYELFIVLLCLTCTRTEYNGISEHKCLLWIHDNDHGFDLSLWNDWPTGIDSERLINKLCGPKSLQNFLFCV